MCVLDGPNEEDDKFHFWWGPKFLWEFKWGLTQKKLKLWTSESVWSLRLRSEFTADMRDVSSWVMLESLPQLFSKAGSHMSWETVPSTNWSDFSKLIKQIFILFKSTIWRPIASNYNALCLSLECSPSSLTL